MEPVEALDLDSKVIGYTISRRRETLHKAPSSKDLGKPLALCAILQENGVEVFRYPTMITWRPEIFGGYVELLGYGFLDRPLSLLKASEVGRERKIWTFVRLGKRFKAFTLTKDFSKLWDKCNTELIDRVCKIDGRDLLLLSSVQTLRQTYRCIRFDTSVFYNNINLGLDCVTTDHSKSSHLFKWAAKAADQALLKFQLRQEFVSHYEELVEKYGNLVLPRRFEGGYDFDVLQQKAIENKLFMDLTRSTFANEFSIGTKDGISTSQRLERFLTAPALSVDSLYALEIYDSIERKDIEGLALARDRLRLHSKANPELVNLMVKTADEAMILLRASLLSEKETVGTNSCNTYPVLAPQCPGEELVIDAANFAFYRGRPSLRRLRSVVNDLRRRGFKLTILMDHSAMSGLERWCTADEVVFLHNNVNATPAGRRGDEYILDYAHRNGLRVVSGDSFREYARKFPWVSTRRVVKPAVSIDGMIVFSYGIED